ncbi:MAG TPA: CHAT domain-containing protein, partial [Thermoanaerobaculia bacterium]|nr:CHAT domain-containing protein [Thermoanaerobaculia bacterium]
GATILCYWLGRDRSYAWRVTPNEVAHAVLPAEKTIAREVEAYRKTLATSRGTLSASGTRGQQLYRMLVAPIAPPLAKNARVVIVADGILHALNFETLVPPSAPMHYWIEDVVVTSAGSLQPPAPRKPAAEASLLLVGDPAPAVKEFPKLQHAAREMQTVASHFGRRVVLQGAKATPAAYKQAAPQKFEFVHFAAHGVATRKRPLDSAVILSRDPANGYKLLARDILAQPLQARLVTISSCHGAGERTFAGEGLVGLAWAFLGAGADQVIAALTEVDDSVAPELMNRMYASIRKGRDPATALRDAKLTFVNGKGAYRMPQYWAPFVLYSGS